MIIMEWTSIISLVLEVVIAGVIVALVKYLLPAASETRTYELIRKLVAAAEKLFEDYESGTASDLKYNYVLDYLNNKGLELNEDDIRMMVNSAIKELDSKSTKKTNTKSKTNKSSQIING